MAVKKTTADKAAGVTPETPVVPDTSVTDIVAEDAVSEATKKLCEYLSTPGKDHKTLFIHLKKRLGFNAAGSTIEESRGVSAILIRKDIAELTERSAMDIKEEIEKAEK